MRHEAEERGHVAAAITLLTAPGTVEAQSVDEPVDLGTVDDRQRGAGAAQRRRWNHRLRSPVARWASCPGDSRNDQWRVQTFIVPSDIDPGALSYNSIGPEGDGLYALYGLDTNPITAVLTGPNGAPGLPGLIIGLRAASFEIFPPGTLPDGTYKVGVACTYFGDTAGFWDTLIEISRDLDDQPAEIRWETTSGATGAVSGIAPEEKSNSGTVAIVAAVVLAIVAAGVHFARRSRRSPVPTRRCHDPVECVATIRPELVRSRRRPCVLSCLASKSVQAYLGVRFPTRTPSLLRRARRRADRSQFRRRPARSATS